MSRPRSRPCTARRAEQGFSLVELTLATAVLGLALLGIVQGNLRAEQSNADLLRRGQRLDHAATLIARLSGLGFGSGGDTASADQIAEVLQPSSPTFDGIELPTLTELRNKAPLVLQYAGSPDGTWEVWIETDLNGDGDTADPLEGSADLFCIRVLCDGELVLQQLCGREPNE